jgi:hypothetical protein
MYLRDDLIQQDRKCQEIDDVKRATGHSNIKGKMYEQLLHDFLVHIPKVKFDDHHVAGATRATKDDLSHKEYVSCLKK